MAQRSRAMAIVLLAGACAAGAGAAGDRGGRGRALRSAEGRGRRESLPCLGAQRLGRARRGRGSGSPRAAGLYLVTLLGACRPDLARSEIAIASRPGSPCLQRFDEIRTGREVSFGQACTVEGLYRWNAQNGGETSGADRGE